ncbi:MAG: hypothetical protein JNK17_15620 [Hydrogenophaga sp.]|nr:hypothetical protein [Hydrogenophaga sp.]
MHNIRSLMATGALAVLLASTTAGCMAPVQAVNAIEQSAARHDLDQGIAVLRAHIRTLQDKGDPLGDYFYALGNSDGWITDVTDPKAITALFEKAAARGSMDAKILLALQVAMNQTIPGQLDRYKVPSRDLTQWEQGLARLLPLLQQQCNVRRLVIDMGKPRVKYYSIAYEVWPVFRDGYYRYNSDGSRTLLRDPVRQKAWESLDNQCPTPQEEWLDR